MAGYSHHVRPKARKLSLQVRAAALRAIIHVFPEPIRSRCVLAVRLVQEEYSQAMAAWKTVRTVYPELPPRARFDDQTWEWTTRIDYWFPRDRLAVLGPGCRGAHHVTNALSLRKCELNFETAFGCDIQAKTGDLEQRNYGWVIVRRLLGVG